jgi:N-carbamoylputrescine amidase
VIASNRIGVERFGCSEINFYGSSFITNQRGELVREADRTSETVLVAEFDLDELEKQRAAWGVFRDRRPELYGPLLTNDGCL